MTTVSHWSRWLLISLAINGAILVVVHLVPIAVPNFGGDQFFAIHFLPNLEAQAPLLLPEPPPPVEPTTVTPQNVLPGQAMRVGTHHATLALTAKPATPVTVQPAPHQDTTLPPHPNTGAPSETPGPGTGATAAPAVMTSPTGTTTVPPGVPGGTGTGGSADLGPPGISRPPQEKPGLTGLARYPKDAQYNGVMGTAVVTVLFDTRGVAKSVSMKQNSGSDLLDQAASRAAKASEMEPALKDGKPVEGTRDIQYIFHGDILVKGEVL